MAPPQSHLRALVELVRSADLDMTPDESRAGFHFLRRRVLSREQRVRTTRSVLLLAILVLVSLAVGVGLGVSLERRAPGRALLQRGWP